MTKQTLETLAEKLEERTKTMVNPAYAVIRAIAHSLRETAAALPGEGEAPRPTLRAFIESVERDHFRTKEDSGANMNAMLMVNIARRMEGLPWLTLEDLPAYDKEADRYVMPSNSKLLRAQKEESPTVPVSVSKEHAWALQDATEAAETILELQRKLSTVKAELEAAKAKLARMTARTVDSQSLKGLMIEYHEDDNRWYVHKPDGHFVWSGEPFFNAWRCALQDEQIKELIAKLQQAEASLAKAHAEAGMREALKQLEFISNLEDASYCAACQYEKRQGHNEHCWLNKILSAEPPKSVPYTIEIWHPEATCADCGTANVIWFAPNKLWNAVMREGDRPEPIICPRCFAVRATKAGIANAFQLVEADTFIPRAKLDALRAVANGLYEALKVYRQGGLQRMTRIDKADKSLAAYTAYTKEAQ